MLVHECYYQWPFHYCHYLSLDWIYLFEMFALFSSLLLPEVFAFSEWILLPSLRNSWVCITAHLLLQWLDVVTVEV